MTRLRIASARSPYLRAGLSWPAREPVEVAIVDLDGARFLELLVDPVLTVTGGSGNGEWSPVPAPFLAGGTVEDLQFVIDTLRHELPEEVETPPPSMDRVIAERDDAVRQLAEAFTARAHAVDSINSMRAEIDALTEERDELKAQLAARLIPADPKPARKPKVDPAAET